MANGARLVRFRASERRANAALAGLVWQGDLDWFGADWLNITVNDLGFSGSGGPRDGSRTLYLAPAPANDAPQLLLDPKASAFPYLFCEALTTGGGAVMKSRNNLVRGGGEAAPR